jgi:hypothetical protein
VSHVLDSAVGAGSNKHLPGSDGCLLVTGYHTGFKTQGKQDHVSPGVTKCHPWSISTLRFKVCPYWLCEDRRMNTLCRPSDFTSLLNGDVLHLCTGL